MNPEHGHRSLLMFASHAWDEAERRFDRAADATLIAMIAWAHMREAKRRLLDRKPPAKVQQAQQVHEKARGAA